MSVVDFFRSIFQKDIKLVLDPMLRDCVKHIVFLIGKEYSHSKELKNSAIDTVCQLLREHKEK